MTLDKLYSRLRRSHSVLRASKFSVLKMIEILVLWVYCTISLGFTCFGASFFKHCWVWICKFTPLGTYNLLLCVKIAAQLSEIVYSKISRPEHLNHTMADSGRHITTFVFDIVHVHFLRNVHVHFTTSLFLTLNMYSSCFKNVHVQFDNFSTLRPLEHAVLIRIPFCFSFTRFHMNLVKQGRNKRIFQY